MLIGSQRNIAFSDRKMMSDEAGARRSAIAARLLRVRATPTLGHNPYQVPSGGFAQSQFSQ